MFDTVVAIGPAINRSRVSRSRAYARRVRVKSLGWSSAASLVGGRRLRSRLLLRLRCLRQDYALDVREPRSRRAGQRRGRQQPPGKRALSGRQQQCAASAAADAGMKARAAAPRGSNKKAKPCATCLPRDCWPRRRCEAAQQLCSPKAAGRLARKRGARACSGDGGPRHRRRRLPRRHRSHARLTPRSACDNMPCVSKPPPSRRKKRRGGAFV